MLNTSRVLQKRLRCPPTSSRKATSPSWSLLLPGSTKHYSTAKGPPSTSLPKPRLDYRSISENVVFKSLNAFNRKAGLSVGAIQTIENLYAKQKEISGILNSKRHTQSQIEARIQKALRHNDATAKQAALNEAKSLKAQIGQMEKQLVDIEDQLYDLASSVPNDTHPDVPIGPENLAVTLSTHGPHPLPADPARDHVAVGKALGLFDLEAGSQVTGSSWYYLTNEGAILEMALTNYALSVALNHGFSPVITPDVVRTDIARRCGFQPRDHTASQSYHISTVSPASHSSPLEHPTHVHPDLVLAGTAEIPLAGLFANKIIPNSTLPQNIVGYGRAFRAEAGARGADTRGLYRVHQFTKVELFVVSKEEESEALMEEMRKIQVEIFEGLGLSFRVLDMPTEELGASAYRKYDMEAWMPGRGGWGEISSTSNCTDYQSRRLHIRYRKSDADLVPSSSGSSQLAFAHTLNGTAAAVPRLIVALLENGVRFNETGSVVGLDLPSVLERFWLGKRSELIRWV
ncbi:seryl-tRNA synthetase [Thelephora terrestris]|uniref:serine--tRNA ligase n=1 Tax=Thelephora terrestris TaxID=56493 RepID=A0A9P6H367_9AGAM|nr:seryl-tRNA synthetase [Thelephora terrestris]